MENIHFSKYIFHNTVFLKSSYTKVNKIWWGPSQASYFIFYESPPPSFKCSQPGTGFKHLLEIRFEFKILTLVSCLNKAMHYFTFHQLMLEWFCDCSKKGFGRMTQLVFRRQLAFSSNNRNKYKQLTNIKIKSKAHLTVMSHGNTSCKIKTKKR